MTKCRKMFPYATVNVAHSNVNELDNSIKSDEQATTVLSLY